MWTSRAVRDLIALALWQAARAVDGPALSAALEHDAAKPLARARERSPAAVAAWLEQHYPAIARRARAERCRDLLGRRDRDLQSGPDRPVVRAQGATPVVVRTAKRVTQSMISAVSNRGLMRFMLYEGALNADRFIAFLRRLIKDAGQKVFLIVDNLKVHHAAKVTAWVAAHAHEIELFYLPAYAPDHNPDEYLNNDLKQKLRQQPQPGSKDALIRSTRAVLRAIQRSPRRIQAYFKPPAVRYAA